MESSEMEEIHPPQSRNIKRALQTGAEQFPEEIIEEILARLPVKSLLKFRCVSKSWRSLIGSQNFIKAHLENSKKNTNFTHHRVILSSFPPQSQSTLKHCSLYSLLNNRTTNAFDFDNPIFASSASIRIVGCCNGLVCILIDRRDFFLWNPSTRVSKKLPDLDHMVKHGHVTKYGFGFVAEEDDYKVFAFLSLFLFPGRYLGKRKVYSLKTDTWETVKDKDCSSPFDEAGKFAGGKLHWVRRFGLKSEWNIAWFDLKSNVFGALELPNFGEGAHCLSLGVIDGCLCVLRNYGESSLDVWVLKEYCVKESWCKVVTIPYLWDSCECTLFSPLCVGSNRRTLFIYGSTPVIYNPKDNSFLHREIVKIDEFREPNVYVESLVSPFVDGGEEANHEMGVY